MITKSFSKKKRIQLSCLFLLLVAACSPSTVVYKRQPKALPSAGERIHEALLVAQEGQVCKSEKLALLQLKKSEIISNIDLLLHDFPISSPDETLFKKRIDWVLNTPIESGFEYLAGVLRNAKAPLEEGIEVLFPAAKIPLPTSEELWRAVLFAKKPEIKVLEARARAGLSQETLEVLQNIKEIADSDRGRFILNAISSSQNYWMPTEERALYFHSLAQKEDVKFLAHRLLDAFAELMEPSDKTRDLLFTANQVRSRLILNGESTAHPTKERLLRVFRVLQSDELNLLVDGSIYKGLDLDATEFVERIKPLYAFFKSPESQNFVSYLKRMLTDTKTRNFILDFADFARQQRGFFEKYFLSLCLGESWTSLTPGRDLCVQRMKWAGLNAELSRELLDHGAILYQNGFIESALGLESYLRDLQYKYRDEMGLFKMLLQRVEPSLNIEASLNLRSYLENEENRGKAIYYFEELFENRLDESLIRLFGLVNETYKSHSQDVGAIKRLIASKNISIKHIQEKEVEAAIDFFNEEQSQLAIAALKDLIHSTQLGSELKRLFHIIMKIPQNESETLESLRSLAPELNISLTFPSRKAIKQIYAFINDPEKIAASKSLAKTAVIASLGFREFQSFFDSFPGEPIDYWSVDTREKIFSAIDHVSEADTIAFWSLIRTGFDLWSISQSERCEASDERVFVAKNIASEMEKWSHFLLDQERGLKSILALVRRIAKDTPLT